MRGVKWGVAALAACLVTLAAVATVSAQDGIKKVPVQFKAGASSATVKVTIKGDETIDYVLGAKAGQKMTVTLTTANKSAYFNLLPPGSTDVATFIGSNEGNKYEGTLDKDGDWIVRLYLMRSAARRGSTAACTLTFAIAAK